MTQTPEPVRTTARIDPITLLLIAGGGAVGVFARAAISMPFASSAALPWITAGINLVGAFLLGSVISMLRSDQHRWRSFAGAGVLGGFTTYSAFAVDIVALTADPGIALALVLVSVLGGVIGAWCGLTAGRTLHRSPGTEPQTGDAS